MPPKPLNEKVGVPDFEGKMLMSFFTPMVAHTVPVSFGRMT